MKIFTYVILVIFAAWTSATPTPTPTAFPLPGSTQRAAITLAARTIDATVTDVNSISQQFVTIAGVTNSHVTISGKTITLAIPTCIQTIPPDANGYVPPGTCGAIWDYYPSFGAALSFAVLFAALTILHLCQAVRYRKGFCWVIIMASAWETMAFTFRTISTRHQQNKGIYLVFQGFILLAPLWINAFAYMVLGRMIYNFLPSKSLFSIRAPVIAAIFVSLDIVSFIIQLVGGNIAGPSAPAEEQLRAIHIYMGGIGLQEFFIVVFLVLAAKFHHEMSTSKSMATTIPTPGTSWKLLLSAVYVSLGLITVRIVFRFIEFSRGSGLSNALMMHEAYFYVLEATPMFLALSIFVVVHPGSTLVGPEANMPGFFATLTASLWRKKAKQEWKKISDGEELMEYGQR